MVVTVRLKIQKACVASICQRSNFSLPTKSRRSGSKEVVPMLRSLNRPVPVRALALILGFVVAGACTLDTDNTLPAGIAKTAGDLQTAPANTVLPTALELVVVNQFGEPLKNITVNWTITSGGGSISGTPTLTTDGGVASVTYTTGPTPGTATISAQVHGMFPVVYTITIT
jgi:hypothetical protein